MAVKQKQIWRWLATELTGMGVGGSADARTLERYCDYAVAFRETTSLDAKIRIGNAMLRIEQEFGLTPSARARLAIEASTQPKAEPELRSKIVG